MTIRPTIWLNDFIVRLNPNPLQPLREPRITQLTNGNFLVSWADSFNLDDTATGSDVIGQVFDPLGVPIGGRIRINSNTSDNESEADIAAMPGGGFVVVYTDDSATGTAIRFDIRSATGALVSSGTVDSRLDTVGRIDDPQIVAAPDGSFAVVWFSLIGGFPFSGAAPIMQIFDASGNPTSNQIDLNSGARAGFDVGVRTANSTFIFAVADVATAGKLSSISIQAFGSTGTPTTTGNLATITAASGVEFFDPQIAGLTPTATLPSGGRYVVVWTSDSGTNDGIFFSIFDGTQVIVSQRAVTSDSERDNEPTVVALPDGGFFIVWDDDTNGRLEGQRFSATGALVGGQLLLATGGVAEPSLSLTADGRILVSWNELGQIHSMILDPRLNPITGTAGNDVLTAPTEDSNVNGLGGNDQLFGSLFNDTLDGSTGNDSLFGRDGNDRLIAGDGNDSVFGGVGNDTMLSGLGNDFYDGGSGSDRVDYQTSTGAVFIDLTVGAGAFGHAQGDRYIGVENIVGSAFNDNISGNGFDNGLSGIGGDDLLNGLAGNDDLSGSIGNDTLNGGTGADTLNGGTGFDLASYSSSTVGVTIDLRTGLAAFGEAAGDVFFSIENLRGSAFGDILTGADLGTVIFGGAGDDTLTGGAGDDSLQGDAGNDTLTGGNGIDNLSGGLGTNTLIGGAGNDSYRVDSSTDVIVETSFGPGNGNVVVSTVDYTLAAGVSISHFMAFSGGVANLGLTGNAFSQLIIGNNGDNRLEDFAGAADTLFGGLGNDTYVIRAAGTLIQEISSQGSADRVAAARSFVLAADDNIEIMTTTSAGGAAAINLTGNALAQSITGNAGANRLDGAGGLDTLAAGAGADVFVFTATVSASNVATINNYSIADDRIELDDASFTGLVASGQSLRAQAFVANATGLASLASHRIIYETDTGFLFFDQDGAGGAAAIQFATLAPNLGLSASEFFVI